MRIEDRPGAQTATGRVEAEARSTAHALETTHPGPKQYLLVASVLVVITAVEVGVYYVGFLRPFLTPILLALSASKFALVALFYMHLKFDSRLYTGLFVLGLGIAAAMLFSLMVLFAYHSTILTAAA